MSRLFVGLEEIAEQRRLNWPAFHPEDFCHRCGGRNLKSWHTPSPLWNAVMDVDLDRLYQGIVCPQCFVELAELKGFDTSSWCVRSHDLAGPALSTTDGDGRRWDPATCLWLEP